MPENYGSSMKELIPEVGASFYRSKFLNRQSDATPIKQLDKHSEYQVVLSKSKS